MSRYAVIDKDGNVLNCVVMNPGARWQPPAGCYVVDVSEKEHVGPGSTTADKGKTFKRAPKGKPE